MRIASFNINGTKARLPRLLEWLAETRPAVACLQEIKCQAHQFPAAALAVRREAAPRLGLRPFQSRVFPALRKTHRPAARPRDRTLLAGLTAVLADTLDVEPGRIDPRGPRFAATLTTVVLAVALLSSSTALTVALDTPRR